MKNLFVVSLFALMISACSSNEEIVPQNDISNPKSSPLSSCNIIGLTHPEDGNCPATYNFITFPVTGTNYSWSVTGDAYFNSGTTSSSSSVIVQRDQSQGEFTISVSYSDNGVTKSCSRTYTVTPEALCE